MTSDGYNFKYLEWERNFWQETARKAFDGIVDRCQGCRYAGKDAFKDPCNTCCRAANKSDNYITEGEWKCRNTTE